MFEEQVWDKTERLHLAHNMLRKRWEKNAKYSAGLSICGATIHSHDGNIWLTLPNPCISCVSCSFFCAIFVVSLRDYQCRRPARVVSSAAVVVATVLQHGEMLRLINRRQNCLNTKKFPFLYSMWSRFLPKAKSFSFSEHQVGPQASAWTIITKIL